MICSWWCVNKYAGNFAVGSCCLFILTEPLLDHRRVSWLLHNRPVPHPMRHGIQFPMDDTVFVLQMLATVVPFLLLVPVRIRTAWIVPVLLPVVYIFSTLPLPPHGVENGIINRLSAVFLLSTLGIVLMVAAARMEAASQEIFNYRYAQKQSVGDDMLEVKNSGMHTTAVQSDPPWMRQDASIQKRRASSSKTLGSLAYSDSESSFNISITPRQCKESSTAKSSTFEAAPDPGFAELWATQNDLAALQAELHATQKELVDLKAELCAAQYVNQLNIFAAKAIFKTHAEEMQRQHWLNTRAVVQSMTNSHRSSRAVSARRRSQSVPPSRQVQIESAQSGVSSQSGHGVPSTLSSMQPLRHVSSPSQPQSPCIRNEDPQFSHLPHVNKMRKAVSQSSSQSDLGACSSSSSGSPQRTSQGSMCLDGDWEIIMDDSLVETWLQRFSIRGTVVQDGVGQVLSLTRNKENQVCFEGGVLLLEGDVLHRLGNSGKIVSFRRCRRNASPS